MHAAVLVLAQVPGTADCDMIITPSHGILALAGSYLLARP